MAFAVNAILNDLLSLCTYSADHDDEEDEVGDVESSQDRAFFVADQDVVEESSQSFYRQQDAASLQRDVESVEPYFPLAFAESADRPLAFNFDLFLLDSLSLPRHIVPRDSREEVSNAVLFDNAASAISYCTERLERGWKDTRPAADPTERASRRHTHPKVNKWELFRRHSARLTEALSSGQAPFDANLKPRSHGQVRYLETLVKSYFLFLGGGGGLFARTGDILFFLFPIYWRFY